MTVKAILSRKGNSVVTIAPTVPLYDAIKILDEHPRDGDRVECHARVHLDGLMGLAAFPSSDVGCRPVRRGADCSKVI